MFKRIKIIALGTAVLSMLAAGACGINSAKIMLAPMSERQVMRHAGSVLSPEEMELFSVPFSISSEIESVARTVDTIGFSKIYIAKKLALLLLQETEGLGITYSRNSNATALEVYAKREANCISYTNIFIGMARALGIEANFAEVTEVQTFDKVGDTVVFNSHICAVVFEGPRSYLVDFSLREYPQYHSWRAISDLEAIANFYNNIGSNHYLNQDESDRIKKAMTYFNLAVKLFPNAPQVHNNIGVVLLNQGDIQGAEASFRKALQVRPGYFAAYNNLSSIYIRRGEPEKAVKLVEDAIKASPNNYFAYYTLARLYLKSNDYAKAEEALRNSLGVNKRYTDARHELGRLYLRTGRGKEALEQFALALKYQPNDDIARNKMELIHQLTLDK